MAGGRGGRKGGLRGIGGGMTSHLEFWVQMFTICAQKSPETTHSSLFRGLAGCIYSIERSSSVLENYSARLSSISFCEI
jgi:hypothetical protein